jgi:hypothetical protein
MFAIFRFDRSYRKVRVGPLYLVRETALEHCGVGCWVESVPYPHP